LAAEDAAQHATQHLAAQAPGLVACDLLHHAIALAAARAGRAEQEFAEDAADAAALVAVLGGGLGVRRLRLLGLRLGLIRQHLGGGIAVDAGVVLAADRAAGAYLHALGLADRAHPAARRRDQGMF